MMFCPIGQNDAATLIAVSTFGGWYLKRSVENEKRENLMPSVISYIYNYSGFRL